MKASLPISVTPLGQSGFRFESEGFVAYIDPYLSNHVEECEGSHLRRMVPAPLQPQAIRDADVVLITHIHLDHCDPQTLGPIATASPHCKFIGPHEVIDYLRSSLDIPMHRLVPASEAWMEFHRSFRVCAVPAAHRTIETDERGHWRCVGYVFELGGKRIYHSGDCSVDPEIVSRLKELAPIDVAMLPVNECNYYREQAGIVGNMSVREAFGLAAEIGVPKLVPMHYDMFAPNCVYPEEIKVVYEKSAPSFELLLQPTSL